MAKYWILEILAIPRFNHEMISSNLKFSNTSSPPLSMTACARMQSWGLNTYLYGPKDDLKHRLLWREVYSPEEEGKNIQFIHSSIC